MSVNRRILELKAYLEQEKLHRTFMLILSQRTLTEARYNQITDISTRLRSYLLQVDTVRMTQHVVRTQVSQLDLISKIFMLLEDYLTFSYLSRNSLVELPDKIASQESFTGAEFTYLKSLSETETRNYFLMPCVSDLPLNLDEKQFVEINLAAFAKDVQNRIKRIVSFSESYLRVYNKYKHNFSVILGMYNQIAPHRFGSHIWVRDYEKGEGIKSYAIPVDISALEYYEQTAEDIATVFGLLNFVYLNYLQNKREPFLIPSDYFVPDTEKKRWAEIVEKVNSYIDQNPVAVFNFQFKGEALQKLRQDTHTKFIHKVKADILSGEKFEASRVDTKGP